jgi:hypothetical protein
LVTFPEKGERERVYAFSEMARRRWSGAAHHDVLKQLYAQQELVEEPSKTFNKHLKAVTGGGNRQ